MAEENRPNLLMIAVDDLRTKLGCLKSHIVSPNTDRLTAGGLHLSIGLIAWCQLAGLLEPVFSVDAG